VEYESYLNQVTNWKTESQLPTPYKINCFVSSVLTKVLADFLSVIYLLTLVLKTRN
jgi:hypothetical protein